MRWHEIIFENQSQEDNLRANWPKNKPNGKVIAHESGLDVVECDNDFGKVITYVVRNDEPLGYCSCYQDKDTLYINSTFITANERQKGLGEMLYKALMKKGWTLISDWDRSAGANALWAKLSRDPALDIQDNGMDRFIGKLA